MFEVRSKGDICEDWASNATRVQNKASTWPMNDALSVAVTA
jgi:hypothetical protein